MLPGAMEEYMNFETLRNGLVEECAKLHAGEPCEIKIPPGIDADAIQKVEGVVRCLYRELFGGELSIVVMKRDPETSVLRMVLKRSEEGGGLEERE